MIRWRRWRSQVLWTRLREEVKKVVEVENVEEIMLEEVCKVKIQM